MTEEQKRLLNHRLLEALAQHPELVILKRLLLTLGGTHLVAPPSFDHATHRLITEGFVMGGPIHRKPMQTSRCHHNVSKLWMRKRRVIIGIGTGYALTNDDLWRQHSWGLLREGILETTWPREKYFGILLQSANADSFADSAL